MRERADVAGVFEVVNQFFAVGHSLSPEDGTGSLCSREGVFINVELMF